MPEGRILSIPASHNFEDILSGLTADDAAMLVSLPYRIGLYVSYSDVTGGWDAQERELQSLSNILRQYSEDFCKSPFCQKLLMETLNRRLDWPSWAQNIDALPDQAGRSIGLVSSHLTEKELRGFKEVLIDIAISVAMAFHEGWHDEDDKIIHQNQGFVSSLLSKIKGGDKQVTAIDHIHISRSERAALSRVCEAMKHRIQE